MPIHVFRIKYTYPISKFYLKHSSLYVAYFSQTLFRKNSCCVLLPFHCLTMTFGKGQLQPNRKRAAPQAKYAVVGTKTSRRKQQKELEVDKLLERESDKDEDDHEYDDEDEDDVKQEDEEETLATTLERRDNEEGDGDRDEDEAEDEGERV